MSYFAPVNQLVKVHLSLFLVAVIYGANYSITKMVTPAYIMPAGLVGLRVVLGSFLFWLVQYFGQSKKITSQKDYFLLFTCGLFGITANQLLFVKGLSLTNPINASLLITLTPILVLVISSVTLKEKITPLKLVGLFIGVTGTVLLLAGKDFSFNSQTLRGDLLLLVSTIFYGSYLVMVKPLSKRYQALTITKWAFLFGMLLSLPFSITQLQAVAWEQLPISIWWALVFVILGATFIAYLANNWALQHVQPSVVGIYIYLQPFLASLIAVGLGKDQLTLDKVFPGLLILLGVYLVSKKRKEAVT